MSLFVVFSLPRPAREGRDRAAGWAPVSQPSSTHHHFTTTCYVQHQYETQTEKCSHLGDCRCLSCIRISADHRKLWI